MQKGKKDYTSIDEYIRTFPPIIQKKLRELRRIIREEAPQAGEKISYQMPCFALHGNLVYFAAHEKHIGFYPTSSGIEAFKSELTKYKTSRGTVQFPIEEPLPVGLIRKMVRFRVEEDMMRSGRPKRRT